jgi:hypothetical protein
MTGLNKYLEDIYGAGQWVSYYTNEQVYLNEALAMEKKIAIADMEERCAEYIRRLDGVAGVLTGTDLLKGPDGIKKEYQNGYYYKRSGNVFIELNSGWIEAGSRKGTTHGSPYEYDTHVPLIWYGWNIPSGSSAEAVDITDIAPTLADQLHIMAPSGCIGRPLHFRKQKEE